MRVFSAKVQKGVLVAGEVTDLPEGLTVMVSVVGDDGRFELSPDEKADLLEAIAEADRGELVPADEVLQSLRQ